MNFPSSHNAVPHTSLETRISAAIEHQAPPMIRADFASRVTSRAMDLPKRTRTPQAHYARTVSMVLSAILLAAMFVLAPHAQPSFASISFDLELTLTVLLSGLLFGLTLPRKESL